MTVSVLTACASTKEPMATIVNNKPPMSAMTLPVRPLPPKNGKPAELLRFATQYGAYCQQLENNIKIITKWGKLQNGLSR
ncbi:hypothetical protein A9G30_09325 [Gilliamella sp. Fer4-1]|nr:hypothetical protein A9G30_09325 [Gilliamella apicola]